MTIIEAIKSGGRVKRAVWPKWVHPSGAFYKEDILADDWEIEPEEKPKLKAWIGGSGSVYLVADNVSVGSSWIRAEWLDEK